MTVGEEDQVPESASWTAELTKSFELLDEVAASRGWEAPWTSPAGETLDGMIVAQWLEENVTSEEARDS